MYGALIIRTENTLFLVASASLPRSNQGTPLFPCGNIWIHLSQGVACIPLLEESQREIHASYFELYRRSTGEHTLLCTSAPHSLQNDQTPSQIPRQQPQQCVEWRDEFWTPDYCPKLTLSLNISNQSKNCYAEQCKNLHVPQKSVQVQL